MLWKLKLIPNKPILLAPRGELMEGALSLKAFKKRIFLNFAKLFRIYQNVTWHASSEYEAEDIEREFGAKLARRGGIKIALDVPNYNFKKDFDRKHKKKKVNLKFYSFPVLFPKRILNLQLKS